MPAINQAMTMTDTPSQRPIATDVTLLREVPIGADGNAACGLASEFKRASDAAPRSVEFCATGMLSGGVVADGNTARRKAANCATSGMRTTPTIAVSQSACRA